MQGHKNWVQCVSWSPDAAQVVSGDQNGVLWLWNPKTGQPIGSCRGGFAAFSTYHSRRLFHLSLTQAQFSSKAIGHMCCKGSKLLFSRAGSLSPQVCLLYSTHNARAEQHTLLIWVSFHLCHAIITTTAAAPEVQIIWIKGKAHVSSFSVALLL